MQETGLIHQFMQQYDLLGMLITFLSLMVIEYIYYDPSEPMNVDDWMVIAFASLTIAAFSLIWHIVIPILIVMLIGVGLISLKRKIYRNRINQKKNNS